VNSPTGHSQFYDQRAKKIFTPETGITVNLLDAQPDVGEQLTVMAAGGSLPDGSWFGVVADGNAGREQASRSIFKPLDELIKKDAKLDIKPCFKSMLDSFSVGDKLFALPIHAHYGTNVIYYNKNLTDAAGIRVSDDGVEQVFGGAGSPGGRTDVWQDNKLFKERDPIYAAIVKAFPQGAGSLRFPANYRYTALTKALNTSLDAFMKGQLSVTEAVSQMIQAGTVELSQQ
jgi:ABC-type glycerol-3-phosphate transport system substrate-binding protein